MGIKDIAIITKIFKSNKDTLIEPSTIYIKMQNKNKKYIILLIIFIFIVILYLTDTLKKLNIIIWTNVILIFLLIYFAYQKIKRYSEDFSILLNKSKKKK